MSDTIKTLVRNRKAKHEYTLGDSFEAGIVLRGTEVKSLRNSGASSLNDTYVDMRDSGAWLIGFYIAPYDHATRENHETRRARQLLLHKSEISKLRKATSVRGMTLVPVHVYFKGSRVKVEIAIGKGKKLHDKRQSIKKRDIEKQLRRIR